MITLLYQGQYVLFVTLAAALVISLTFHEYGHAAVAKHFGDDTAERAGRLTLNPLAHIDPVGFLMVVFVGFGYAKPVPTDPRNFTSAWASGLISAAGPFMNLLVAVLSWNFYLYISQSTTILEPLFDSRATFVFFLLLAKVNLLLMLFNLLPIAPLDGHYILPYVLPRHLRDRVMFYNVRFGPFVLLSLIGLSLLGFPVLTWVLSVSDVLLPLISWTGSLF